MQPRDWAEHARDLRAADASSTAMSVQWCLKSCVTARHAMRRPLVRESLKKSAFQTSLMAPYSCSGTRSTSRHRSPRHMDIDRAARL
jgi:hypothetical protein